MNGDELLEECRTGSMTVEELTDAVFSEDGPLVAAGFELRDGQRRLALMVARLIDSGGWSAAEAPTGSGKGLAYLIPGILGRVRFRQRDEVAYATAVARYKRGELVKEPKERHRQLVVTTANIALQDQLVKKDVPGVSKALGFDVSCALLKSRSNYICLSRLEDLELIKDPDVERLAKWARKDGCSGDREDIPFDPGAAWYRLSVDSGNCHKKACPHVGKCFSEQARLRAMASDVLVTNHYFVAARPIAFDSVLIAVDEAHKLEDAVRGVRSGEVRGGQARHHSGNVAKAIRNATLAETMVGRPISNLCDELGAYHSAQGGKGSVPLYPGWTNLTAEDFGTVRAAAGRLKEASGDATDPEVVERLKLQSLSLLALYDRCLALVSATPTEAMKMTADGPWAFWVETDKRGNPVGKAAPADVSGPVSELQKLYPSAALVSATLAVDGKMDSMSLSLGLGQIADPLVEALVLPSPFPLEEMGAVIVPDGPSPKERGWHTWAEEIVANVVWESKGRALVLCTSLYQMRRYGERLKHSCSYPVRVQGEAGRSELRKWFMETTHGVLVGSRSFYEGLDVVGESLSCVVIDRVPFQVPGDPLEDAVCELLVERAGGGSSFFIRSLPLAATALKQAVGRLIRSRADRGAVVCLDTRILGGSEMGRVLRSSLPPFPISRSVSDVGRAIRGEPLESTFEIAKPAKARGRGVRLAFGSRAR